MRSAGIAAKAADLQDETAERILGALLAASSARMERAESRA